MQLRHGTDHTKRYMKKVNHWWKKTCAWILQCQKAIIPRNRHIRSRPEHHIAAGEESPGLWIWWSTGQCNAAVHCICQQEHISYCMMVQQYIETLRILYGLEKFHHYSFVCEGHVITDLKLLVAIMGKHVATLSECLKSIILCIHQYRVCILYKPGHELFTAGKLSGHNDETKDKRQKDIKPKHKYQCDRYISGPVSVYINMWHTSSAIKRCACERAKDIYHKGLATQKEAMAQDIQKYWPMRHELAMIDDIAVKAIE